MKARYGALFAIIMALAVVGLLFASPAATAEGEQYRVDVAPSDGLADKIQCEDSPYYVNQGESLDITITAKGDYYFLGGEGKVITYTVGGVEHTEPVDSNTTEVVITIDDEITGPTNIVITEAELTDKCTIHSTVRPGYECTADEEYKDVKFGDDYSATFSVNDGNTFTFKSTVTYTYTVSDGRTGSGTYQIGSDDTESFTITLTDVQGDTTLEITYVSTDPITYSISFAIDPGLNIGPGGSYTAKYNEELDIKFVASYGYYFTKGSIVTITQDTDKDISYTVPLDGEHFFVTTKPITKPTIIHVTAATTATFVAKDTDNGRSAYFYDALGSTSGSSTPIYSGYLYLQNNATGYIEMSSYYTDMGGYYSTILVQADGSQIKFYDAPFLVHVVNGQADSITSRAVTGCEGTVVFSDTNKIYHTYYANRTGNDLDFAPSASGWTLTSAASNYIGYVKKVGETNGTIDFIRYDMLSSIPSGDYFGELYLCNNASGSITVKGYNTIYQNSVLYNETGAVMFKTLGLPANTSVALTISAGYITNANVPTDGSVYSNGDRFVNNASESKDFGFSSGLIDSGYVCSVLRSFDGDTYYYTDEGAVIGSSSVVREGDKVTLYPTFYLTGSTGDVIADVTLYSAGSSYGVYGKRGAITVTIVGGMIQTVVLAVDNQSFVTYNNTVAVVNKDGSTVSITMNTDGATISSVSVGSMSSFTALANGGEDTTGNFSVKNSSGAVIQLLSSGNKVVYQKVVGDAVTLTHESSITVCSADYAIATAVRGDNIQIFGDVSTTPGRDAVMGDGTVQEPSWTFLKTLKAGVSINGTVIDNTKDRYVHITNGEYYVVKYFGYDGTTKYARWIYYDNIDGDTSANMFYERSGYGGNFDYDTKYFCDGYNGSAWVYTKHDYDALIKEINRNVKILELHNLSNFNHENSFDYTGQGIEKGDYRGENLEKVVLEGLDTIAGMSFRGDPNLKSVSFDGRHINHYTFTNCYNLEEIYTPNLTRVYYNAFQNCTSLKEFHADGTDKTGQTDWYVWSNAFNGCTSLEIVSFKIVTNIYGSAFYGCTSLREVDIPEVTTIEGSAFYGCSSLVTVNMPKVNSIGDSAFYKCTSLGDLYMPVVETIKSNAFSTSTNGKYDYERVYDDDAPTFRHVYMPNIDTIGSSAFGGCRYLETVVVTELDDLGSYAFHSCSSLTSFEAPKITKSKTNSIFINCTSLTTFKADSLTDIEYQCFWGCTALKTVDIKSVQTIGNNAFRYCKSLEYLYLPNVITIGSYAFTGDMVNSGTSMTVNKGCTSLRSLYAPNVNTIKSYAFAGAVNLTDVVISSVKTMEGYCFHGTGITELDAPELTAGGTYMFTSCTNLKSADIRKIGSLGEYCFWGCTKLRTANVSTATTVDAKAFYNCTSLESVLLIKCITINNYVFQNCSALLSLTLPVATSIGEEAFRDCSSLKNADLPKVTTVKYRGFYKCTNLETVSMPSVSLLNGECFSESGLTSVTIGENSACYPIEDTRIILNGSVFAHCKNLTSVRLGGDNVIIDTYNNGSPWQSQFQDCEKLTTVWIDRITDVTYNMFYQCSALYSCTINEAERIWYSAFSSSGLKTLTIGNVTEYIGRADGYGSSLGCTQLKTFTITGDVKKIYKEAFSGCSTMTAVSIGGKVEEDIGYRAFYNCTALVTFTVTGEIGHIGENVFESCTSLDSVRFASTEDIGRCAFYGCQNLKYLNSEEDGTVDLTNAKLLSTSDRCFYNCKAIQKVIFGSRCEDIPNYCFHTCSALTEIKGTNITTVGIGAVYKCDSLLTISLNDNVVPATFNTYDNHAFWHSATIVNFAGFIVTSSAGREKTLSLTDCTVLTYNEGGTSTMSMSSKTGGSSNDVGFSHVVINQDVTIGANAFNGTTLLKDLTIGTDLRINEKSFRSCTSLINVYGGEHILSIGEEAFRYCYNLQNVYESNDYENAYYTLANKSESGLDKVISIPNCKSIGDNAFYLVYNDNIAGYYKSTTNGGKVSELYAPSVTNIGVSSMVSMKLTKVTLGALTELHSESFGRRMTDATNTNFYPSIALTEFICQSYVKKDSSSTAVAKLRTDMFIPNDCVDGIHLDTIGILGTMSISSDYFRGESPDTYITTLILGCPTVAAEAFKGLNIQTLAITGKATLGNNVFEGCADLYEVTIDGSPTFGAFAFKDCTSLKSFTATDESEPILAADLFNGCTNLSSFYVLNVKNIPDRLFAGCTNINKINSNKIGYAIMNNVTTVGKTPFTGITLTHIEMDLIEEIDSNVFSGMTEITYLSLKSASDIDDDSFSGLTKISYLDIRSLKTINSSVVNNVGGGNSVLQTIHIEGATIIYSNAFERCSKLKAVYLDTTSTSGTITVNDSAFRNCSALDTIDLRNVLYAYNYAFYGTKITSINMPYATKIGSYTFYNCTELKEATLDKCSKFGDYCFSCSYADDGKTSGLEKIQLNSKSVALANYMFQYCTNLIYINSTEKGTIDLSAVTVIGEYAFGGCEHIVSAIMPSSMHEIGNHSFDGCTRLVSVITDSGGSGLTIGDYSFRDCKKLATLSFSTVTSVGQYAFQNCMGLTVIDMPMLESMGENAFEGCTGLTTITMDKLTVAPANSFRSCTNLITVSMNSLKDVGQYAFSDCTNLTEFGANSGVLSLSNVTTVQDYAFYNCNKFTSIDFGVYIISIGNYSFYNMPGVTQLIFPNSLTSIGYNAFDATDGQNNYSIVSIPSSVTSIGENAFTTVSSLSIYLNGDISKTSIGSNAFESNAIVKVYLWKEFESRDISSFVSGFSVEKIPEEHIKVFLSSTLMDTDVTYNTVIAMNDGYIIMPYAEYTSGTHETLYFGLSYDPTGGSNNSLALYKVANNYVDSNIAKSGDAFRPVVSYTTTIDKLGLYYVGNESCADIDKSILIDAKMDEGITGPTVVFKKDYYHYRDVITLPSFVNGEGTRFDLSTIYGEKAIIAETGDNKNKVYYNVDEGLTPTTMTLGYMETYFVMTVKKFVATINWIVEDTVWKTTEAYYGDEVGTLPEPPTKSGYHYVCWSTVPGNENFPVKETDQIKSSTNRFYAVYSPNSYTVKVTTDSISGTTESLEFNMNGVFSFTINPLDDLGSPIKGLITYTDMDHTESTNMFDARTWKTGYDFYQYGFGGTTVTTRTVTHNDDMEDGSVFEITLVMTEHTYSIVLQFCNEPSPGSYTNLAYSQISIEPFASSDNKNKYSVEEKVISTELSYGVVKNIPYSKLVDKITVSTPLYKSDDEHRTRYTYSKSTNLTTGKELSKYDSGSMYVNYESFKDTSGVYQDEITIRYVFEEGMYNIRYVYKDDTDSEYINPTTVKGLEGSVFISGIKDKVKTGYTFVNWVLLDKDGNPTDKYYSPNQSMPLTQDILDCADNSNTLSLQAVWSANEVTVKYNLIDYTAVTVPDDKTRTDETYTLPSELTFAFNRSGYVMSGWTLTKDGTDVLTELNLNQTVYGTYVEDDVLTLYAHWSVKTYTFVVQHSDSEHPDAPGINRYTSTYKYVYMKETISLWDADTIDANEQFRTLTGWTCSATDATGTYTVSFETGLNNMSETTWQTIAKIAKILDNDDTLKFEQSWDMKTFTLYFDTNGGGYLSPNTVGPLTVGDEFDVLSGQKLSKHGYSFQGWYCGTDTVTVYTENLDPSRGEKYQLTDTMAAMAVKEILTFTAVWTQSTYTIDYELNGGAATGVLPRSAYYDTQIELSYPTKSGYEFKGWTATGITSSAQYKNGDKWSSWDGSAVFSKCFCYLTWETTAVKMTAQWQQTTYQIVYQTNGGSGTISGGTTSAKVGEGFSLATMSKAEKTGYEFKGWSYDKVNIYPNTTNTFTEELAQAADDNNVLYMYAYWSPISYEVKYNYNGLNVEDESSYIKISARYDEPVKLEHLERTGYTFDGWVGSNIDSTAKYRVNDEGDTWVVWSDPSEPVNAPYFLNLKYTASGTPAKLVAEYTANIYHVVYDSNGGTGDAPKDAGTYKVGDKITLASYESLVGTNGEKSIIGWSTDRNATTASSISSFNETIALQADATNTVTFYAVWVENGCLIKVDLGDASASYVPSGWKQQEDTKYYVKQVQYGSSVKEAMSDWDNVTISKEGYVFSSWEYSASTAISDVMVTCNFDKVENSLIYIIIGAVVAAVVVIFIIARVERH